MVTLWMMLPLFTVAAWIVLGFISYRSAIVVAAGLFAVIVAVFAFYGLAQAEAERGRLLAVQFVATLALIGAVSTWFARRHATPGARKGVATLVSGAIFAALVIFFWALVVSISRAPG